MVKVCYRIATCLTLVLLIASGNAHARIIKTEVFEIINCYSFKIKADDGFEVIRIAEVICPEELLVGILKTEEGQDFLSKTITGKMLTLSYWATDIEGRLVCQVFLPDGRSLGAVLVSKGYLLQDPYYSHSRNLEQLEGVAKRDQRGIWKRGSTYRTL